MPLFGKRLSVVVVYEGRQAREFVRELLLAAGIIDIRWCEDRRSALQELALRTPSAVIFDLSRVDDVVAGVTAIRSQPSRFRQVPVIVLVANFNLDKLGRVRDAGATEILTKPTTRAEFIRHLASALQRPRPFIEGRSYVGPDRRRASSNAYQGPFRRITDSDDTFEVE